MYRLLLLLFPILISTTISCDFLSKGQEPHVMVEDPCDGKDSKMHPDRAREAIALYQEYLKDKKSVPVNNQDVRYFTLAECQMSQITKEFGPNPIIKGHLSIIKGSINLIFEVANRHANARSGNSYYDFNSPCPQLCQ